MGAERFLASDVPQLSSAQNNSYAQVARFGVAFTDSPITITIKKICCSEFRVQLSYQPPVTNIPPLGTCSAMGPSGPASSDVLEHFTVVFSFLSLLKKL